MHDESIQNRLVKITFGELADWVRSARQEQGRVGGRAQQQPSDKRRRLMSPTPPESIPEIDHETEKQAQNGEKDSDPNWKSEKQVVVPVKSYELRSRRDCGASNCLEAY